MLSIVSGRRAKTEMAMRRRAPGAEGSAGMDGTLSRHRHTRKIQFHADPVGRFEPRAVAGTRPRRGRAAARPARARAAGGDPIGAAGDGGAAAVLPRPGPRAGALAWPGARLLHAAA